MAQAMGRGSRYQLRINAVGDDRVPASNLLAGYSDVLEARSRRSHHCVARACSS